MARIKRGNTPRIQFAGSPIEQTLYYEVQVWETGAIQGRSNAWVSPANRVKRSADIEAEDTEVDDRDAGYGQSIKKLQRGEPEPFYSPSTIRQHGRKLQAAGIHHTPSEQAHWRTVATARTEAKAMQSAKTYEGRGYRVRVVSSLRSDRNE